MLWARLDTCKHPDTQDPCLGFVLSICENSFHSLGWPFLSPQCLLPDANSGMLINSRYIILGHSDKDQSLAAGLVRVTGQQLSSHAPDIHQTALRVHTEEVTSGLNLVDNQGRFPWPLTRVRYKAVTSWQLVPCKSLASFNSDIIH